MKQLELLYIFDEIVGWDYEEELYKLGIEPLGWDDENVYWGEDISWITKYEDDLIE